MGEYAEDRLEQEMQNAGAVDSPLRGRRTGLSPTWVSKDGTRRQISDMSDGHLKNAYHHLIREGRQKNAAFAYISAETETRDLDMSPKSEKDLNNE